MANLSGKTLFITGASAASAWRSRCARRATAPTSSSPPRRPSRIRSCPARSTAPPPRSRRPAARRWRCQCDIRDEAQVRTRSRATRRAFGGIDILVNNASAISLTGTRDTPMKRFDLMFGVNVRGTFLCTQACLPHLGIGARRAATRTSSTCRRRCRCRRWFAPHVAYTMAKYGMSMCMLGHGRGVRAARHRASTRCGRAR